MEKTLQYRLRVLIKNFSQELVQLVQFGYAYLFNNVEFIPMLNFKIQAIQLFRKLVDKFPQSKEYRENYHQAYSDYILLLMKLAFLYLKNHPQVYEDFLQLKIVFQAYEKLQKDFDKMRKRKIQNLGLKKTCDYKSCQKTFNSIKPTTHEAFKECNEEVEVIKDKGKLKNIHFNNHNTRHNIKKSKNFTQTLNADSEIISSEEFIKFENYSELRTPLHVGTVEHDEIFKETTTLNEKIDATHDKVMNGLSPMSVKATHEILKEFNDELEQKLEEIKNKRKLKCFGGTHHDIIKTKNDLNLPHESSTENFSQSKSSLKTKSNVGTIEQKEFIPIHSNEAPKVSSKYSLQKSSDGKVKINLNLKFEEEIMYENKIITGICIENIFPRKSLNC
ncbi:CLUMA_CG006760, isoform A [Clunio marinus]|uniref:CLUMA_CG006760, isoform A n=1 Tax=Clunio marinus TaxID=568069 RepID=A0A1J1HYN4_9DIPT|nr:CLUMA_CG006760, isoform A [Clunio marinus]